MATTRPSPHRGTRRALPSMTPRQLDAYLACRETLRRLRDASRSDDAPPRAPPAAPDA
jgi:hypothetical protein